MLKFLEQWMSGWNVVRLSRAVGFTESGDGEWVVRELDGTSTITVVLERVA